MISVLRSFGSTFRDSMGYEAFKSSILQKVTFTSPSGNSESRNRQRIQSVSVVLNISTDLIWNIEY